METFFDSTTNFQQELVSLQGERGGGGPNRANRNRTRSDRLNTSTRKFVDDGGE